MEKASEVSLDRNSARPVDFRGNVKSRSVPIPETPPVSPVEASTSGGSTTSERQRKWRERLKADPVRYEAYKEANRLRMAEKRRK